MKKLKSDGFLLEATKPDNWLNSKIKFRTTEKSLKEYPYLETEENGLIKALELDIPPYNKSKIEYV